MTEILTPSLIIGALGAVCAVILAIASIIMAVPVDEKVEAVKEALPGANCGACGYPGCDGYAAAVVAGEAPPNACPPGGPDLAAIIGEILGVAVSQSARQAALVNCGGCDKNTGEKMRYHGVLTCALENQLYGGSSACTYGCLGHGDCVKVCAYDAIWVENDLAMVDPVACVGCKLCLSACPKDLIVMAPAENAAAIACSSLDKGPVVRKNCSVGCIACTKCVKVCPEGAIEIKNFLAKVDYDKCTGCGLCVPECPQDTIYMIGVGGVSLDK